MRARTLGEVLQFYHVWRYILSIGLMWLIMKSREVCEDNHRPRV